MAITLDARPLAAPPPGFIVRALFSLRRFLLRLADRVLPSELAVFERTIGFGETILLREVARLGVADVLSGGPRDAASLARELGVLADPLHRTLRALVQRGVFTMDAAGRFANNHVSRGLLTPMKSFAEYIGERHNLLAWDRFDEVLRSGGDGFTRAYGESLWSWYEKNPAQLARFASMMADRTTGDASAVATACTFAANATVCHVGGGIGTQLSEVLLRHPTLRGVLFDSPRTLERAPALLRARGVQDRVRLEAGNFFEAVPSGADCYLLKNVLHDWGDEPSLRILANVRAAMTPHSKVLIAEALLEKSDTRHPAALADLHMMMLCDGGRERSSEEMRDLLARAGLRVTRIVHTAVFIAVVEAVPL
jgi:C-methyltransferase